MVNAKISIDTPTCHSGTPNGILAIITIGDEKGINEAH